MKSKAHFFLTRPGALVALGVYMAIILCTSTMPSPVVSQPSQSFVNNVLDFAHFPVYCVLTLLLLNVFSQANFFSQATVFAIACCFGIFNEFVQLHVPGRSFSVKDMAVNSFAALVTIGYLRYSRKKPL